MNQGIEERLNFAISIARELSDFQLNFKFEDLSLQRKEDDTPVTLADRESETRFRKAVAENFPGDVVLGEEEGGVEGDGPRWVIDPIDGTRKFMRGLPFWGICIAYEVEAEVVLGVITVPGAGKIWSASKGGGAFVNGKKILVDTSVSSLNRAFVTMPARSAFQCGFERAVFDELQDQIEHDPGFLDAYSYGMVADGRIHALVSCGDKWWDIASAVCIVEEAGGKFTNWQGGKPSEGQINVAASPALHEVLLDRFKEIDAEKR